MRRQGSPAVQSSSASAQFARLRPAMSAPIAQHRHDSLPLGLPRFPQRETGFSRRGRAPPRTAPIKTDIARPPDARTIPMTRGHSAHHASRPPCAPAVHRERHPEYSAESWGFSATGVRSLSPSRQPVTNPPPNSSSWSSSASDGCRSGPAAATLVAPRRESSAEWWSRVTLPHRIYATTCCMVLPPRFHGQSLGEFRYQEKTLES